MTKLQDLAQRQIAKLADQRERNRARFPFAAEMLDVLNAAGFDARITYAENAKGESIGKRELDDGIDWTLIERAKRWNDRVYGRNRKRSNESGKRHNMTDAQAACFRGEV